VVSKASPFPDRACTRRARAAGPPGPAASAKRGKDGRQKGNELRVDDSHAVTTCRLEQPASNQMLLQCHFGLLGSPRRPPFPG
jgi:hypothetical protein